jgi:hypothetical protein
MSTVQSKRTNYFRMEDFRKPSFSAGRGVPEDAKIEALAKLVIAPENPTIKEVLLKVKLLVKYEANAKALAAFKIKTLRDTLMFLRGSEGMDVPNDVDELLLDGLCFAILRTISNLLPYECGSCSARVCADRVEEEQQVTCRACGIGACRDCYSPLEKKAWSFLCPPCGEEVDVSKITPTFMKKARVRRKGETLSQDVHVDPVIEIVDHSQNPRDFEDQSQAERTLSQDTQSSSSPSGSVISLPLGQGSPAQNPTI